jgi:hypothetical protein
MLTILPVSLNDLLSVLSCLAKRRDWASFCRARGLLAFAVTEADSLEGLAIAESKPRLLHVPYLEGGDDACRLLLQRLIRLAGERAMSVSCRADRTGRRQLLEGCGFEVLFERAQREGHCLYGWVGDGGTDKE